MQEFNLLIDSLCDLSKDKAHLLKENFFLRQQLIVLKRSVKKLKIRKSDRLFLVFFSKILSNWKECLYIVKPETLIAWHRSLATLIWRWKSKSKANPKIPQQTRELVAHIAKENKTWGAERIRGELLKLGIKLAKRSIQKIIRPFRNHPDSVRSQNWRTFLQNHVTQIWAADFFTATTIGFKQIYVFVVFAIHTRKVLHCNLTKHPDAEWTYRQILQSTWHHKTPRFLLCDRDSKYGEAFTVGIANLGIKLLRTPFRAPKANAFLERLIGSIRRECLDHFIILNESHLRQVLQDYVEYYNNCRPHQGIAQAIPGEREVTITTTSQGPIRSRPVLNGLHHHYYRQAA